MGSVDGPRGGGLGARQAEFFGWNGDSGSRHRVNGGDPNLTAIALAVEGSRCNSKHARFTEFDFTRNFSPGLLDTANEDIMINKTFSKIFLFVLA